MRDDVAWHRIAHRVLRPALAYAILTLAGFLFLFPILIMLYRSVERIGFSSYLAVLTSNNLFRNYLNSAIVSAATIAAVVVITSLAAFAFAKLRFPLQRALFLYLLAALMIPTATILLPIYRMNKALGLFSNIASLIGPYTAVIAPFNLLILKNYMDDTPNELMDSARIDGCGTFATFLRIVMPLCVPALLVIVIWTFLSSWNEFMMAYVFLDRRASQTVALLPIRFRSMYGGDLPKIFASLTLITAPVVILYVFLQKYFVQGFTAGALKG